MKKSIFNSYVSLFEGVRVGNPQKVRLADVLLTDKWRAQVEAIRAEPNEEKQKKKKAQLPAFKPSGIFDGLKGATLVSHSGYICIDIDKKDNTEVANFSNLKELIAHNPNVEYCGLSARGKGYFCLIPIADPSLHLEYCKALEADFANCGLATDRTCTDVGRMRFVSYDPEPYINTGAIPYDYVLPPDDTPGPEVSLDEIREHAIDDHALFGACLDEIRQKAIDITTPHYGPWYQILTSIANTMGEEGRSVAHLVSQYSELYSQTTTDKQYTNCLRYHSHYTLGTFFYWFRLAVGDRQWYDLIQRNDFKDINI